MPKILTAPVSDEKRNRRMLCYFGKKTVAMISSKEVITLIKGFSITERLMIVEEILRNIREENWARKVTEDSKEENSVPAILSLAGVIDAEEAGVLNSAVEESRKIDRDEWQLSTGFECRDRHFQRGFGDDSKSQEN